jgi:exonuclease III
LKEGITDVEWIWKRNTKIGMWNVRSLFWSGALKVLHNELSNLNFDVIALQETPLDSGIKKFDNFALFNSALESKKNTNLVAFLCKWRISKICSRFQNYK